MKAMLNVIQCDTFTAAVFIRKQTEPLLIYMDEDVLIIYSLSHLILSLDVHFVQINIGIAFLVLYSSKNFIWSKRPTHSFKYVQKLFIRMLFYLIIGLSIERPYFMIRLKLKSWFQWFWVVCAHLNLNAWNAQNSWFPLKT